MKTQCPNCKLIQNIPDEYGGKTVSCSGCGNSFTAAKFKKPPIVVPRISFWSGFTIARLWTKCPKPFKSGFFATLGVITALCSMAYIFNIIPSPENRSGFLGVGSLPKNITFLYDYEFEQKIDFHRPYNQPVCMLIWHAYIINSFPYSVNTDCFIEFRDPYGFLLKSLGPIRRNVRSTNESDLPADITGIYWMPDDIFRKVDFTNSRLWIE